MKKMSRTGNMSDKQVVQNIQKWISGWSINVEKMERKDLSKIIDLLEMIETKTKSNESKIIFYGEEVFSSEFVKQSGKLKVGFVAKSMFVGIIGSFVAECILEPELLKRHIDYVIGMTDEGPVTLYGFLMTIYDRYEGFSLSFNLDDTFESTTYRRIQDKKGLRYIDEKVTAKLADVDVWDVNRLRIALEDGPVSSKTAKKAKAPKKSTKKVAPKKTVPKKAKTKKVVPKAKKTKVYVVVYIYLDDADEPEVNVFGTKKAAIEYVQTEIRKRDGHEDFKIDPKEKDLHFDGIDGLIYEIFAKEIQ